MIPSSLPATRTRPSLLVNCASRINYPMTNAWHSSLLQPTYMEPLNQWKPLSSIATARRSCKLGPPSRKQAAPALAALPWSDIEWTPLTGLLFTAGFTWLATVLVINLWKIITDESFSPINVVKLQVGVRGPANKLRKELQEVCGGFQGSTSAWLLVEQCIAQLQRNFSRCLLGNVEVNVTSSFGKAQKIFSEVSEKEQALAQAEAEQCFVDDAPDTAPKATWQRMLDASPLGNVWAGDAAGDDATDAPDEIMVVTLLVVTTRQIKVESDGHSRSDVLSVLGQLSGLTNDQILGAQVLWVPDEQGCYIGKAQLQEDFPRLSALT